MSDNEKRLGQLESQVMDLINALNSKRKTGLEWLEEQIAIHEANKVIYQTQKRLNDRLKTVKLKPLVDKEQEKQLDENLKITDVTLAELYQILDEMKQSEAPAPHENGRTIKVKEQI